MNTTYKHGNKVYDSLDSLLYACGREYESVEEITVHDKLRQGRERNHLTGLTSQEYNALIPGSIEE